MATATDRKSSESQSRDARHAVAKAALCAAGGFVSTIATILVVAGTWQIDDGVVRHALTLVGVIAAVALFVTAFIARN